MINGQWHGVISQGTRDGSDDAYHFILNEFKLLAVNVRTSRLFVFRRDLGPSTYRWARDWCA